MVVGESGLGKSTLINSLFLTDLYPERIIPGAADFSCFLSLFCSELPERPSCRSSPFPVSLTVKTSCFNTIIAYIDDQFERYLHDESGLNRRHIVDNRVHCCFYFISPLGHGLKPLDVQFMKAIHNKVNVVPVIAKADTLTLKERDRLKRRILDEIDEHGIKIYHLPDAESDEDEETHMQDLQEVTQDLHYENFRSERLKRGGRLSSHGYILPLSPAKAPEPEEMDKDMILLEKEAELRRMQEMIAKMQAQMQKQGDDGDGQHV
ncbi:Septin-2A [Bagarius yarrelli]|uniref:Septin-2A n=1 Tax=Bagarius yarrelli TaxID=175774 RepID=A0A556V0C4_BAGYA|nr:Septin-2A [Bagarius yarrelli]